MSTLLAGEGRTMSPLRCCILLTAALASAVLCGPVFTQTIPPPDRRLEQALGPTFPSVAYDRLLNGLQVLVVEDHRQPVVLIKLLVKYGAAFDLQGKSGTACLTARALMAAGDDPAREAGLPKLADGDSVSKGTECGQDSVAVWMRVSRRDASTALRYLAGLVVDPEFADSLVDRVRYVEGWNTGREDILERVDAALRIMIYQRHPYARSPHGNQTELASIKASDLSRHYRQFFIARHSVLIVVGDVQPETALLAVRPNFGPMRKGELTPASFIFSALTAGPRIGVRKGNTIAGVGIARAIVARAHVDFLPLTLLDRILDARLRASLATAAREGSSGPWVRTTITGSLMPGYWSVNGAVSSADAGKALATILDHCRRIREESVSLAELDAARQSLLGEFKRRTESIEGIADVLGQVELYGVGRNWAISYPTQLDSVTAGEIQRVARAYLRPETMAGVVVGNVPDQMEALKKLGTVEELP